MRVDGKVKYITVNRFRKYMLEELNVPSLSTQDIDEVVSYLDIDEDLKISEDEWTFMNEMIRVTAKKASVHASYEIPIELQNIDRTVAKVFYDIFDYV